MTIKKIRTRLLSFLLILLTVFVTAFTPYHAVEVEAADIGLTYGIVDSSYEVLQWIFLMMGIGGFQAPNVGVEEDEKGRVVDEFCKEFFSDTWDQWCDQNGIDTSTFKEDFIDCLNQNYDAAKYVAGDIKSSVLNTIYKYIHSTHVYDSDLSNLSPLTVGETYTCSFSGKAYWANGPTVFDNSQTFTLIDCSESVYAIGFVFQDHDNYYRIGYGLRSVKPFSVKYNGKIYDNPLHQNGMYMLLGANADFSVSVSSLNVAFNIPHIYLNSDTFINKFSSSVDNVLYWLITGHLYVPNVDVPNVAGKDYAFDLVGYPWAWDTDQPNVMPWDGVDSLPIPGDIAIGDSFPGVVDLPGIETGVIDGSIPWTDIIQMIKDIDTTPDPDPDPDKPDTPDDDIELPAIFPDGVSDKMNQLKNKFPFCIPFDLVNCMKSVGSSNATPPKFTLEVPIPTTDKTYTFTVDLEMFSPYIGIFKAGVFALFLIGLMLSTRKLIAWQID